MFNILNMHYAKLNITEVCHKQRYLLPYRPRLMATHILYRCLSKTGAAVIFTVSTGVAVGERQRGKKGSENMTDNKSWMGSVTVSISEVVGECWGSSSAGRLVDM